MMEEIIFSISIILTFFTTYFIIKKWIKVAHKFGLVGKDMNKYNKPKVAEAGGIGVLMGLIVGILFFISMKTYVIGTETHLIEIFALLVSTLIAGFIGFIDDILGWLKGLPQLQKVLMTITFTLPLVVIAAGTTTINLPFLGSIDFGILYPLLIVPLIIIITSNGFNLLAGYNGLEGGQGVIILSSMAIIFFITHQYWLVLITSLAISSLIAFLIFNKFPSKVFPGDSLTYSIGTLIGVLAILGNIEKALIILYLIYVLDFILVARSKFKAEAFAKVNKDNSLELPYKKFYDTTHVVIYLLKKIKKKVYEPEVVYTIWIFQIILGIFSILLYV